MCIFETLMLLNVRLPLEWCCPILGSLAFQVARTSFLNKIYNNWAHGQGVKHQGRSQEFPVGGDDDILANWQIEMLRSDVAREKLGVGISASLHLIWAYFPTV